MPGVDRLVPWIDHFGHEPGLGVDDVARFKALAVPDWSRPVTRATLARFVPTTRTRGLRDRGRGLAAASG